VARSLVPDFEERLAAFDSWTFERLRPGQKLVLAKYGSDHLSTPDLAIEMPTGEGKTLVALLIADPAYTLRAYGHMQPGLDERARAIIDRRMFRPRKVAGSGRLRLVEDASTEPSGD
jgi:hypothetical protein